MEIYTALFSHRWKFLRPRVAKPFKTCNVRFTRPPFWTSAVPKGDRRCRKRPEAAPPPPPRRRRISGTRLLNLGRHLHLLPFHAKWSRSNYPREIDASLSLFVQFSLDTISFPVWKRRLQSNFNKHRVNKFSTNNFSVWRYRDETFFKECFKRRNIISYVGYGLWKFFEWELKLKSSRVWTRLKWIWRTRGTRLFFWTPSTFGSIALIPRRDNVV